MPTSQLVSRCRNLALALGIATAAGSSLLLLFWIWTSGGVMSAATLLGLLVGGITLSLQSLLIGPTASLRLVSYLSASLVAALGIVAVAHDLGWSGAVVDHWLAMLPYGVTGLTAASIHPVCGISLALTGCSLLLQDFRVGRNHAPAEYLAIAIITLNLVPLAGHAYQVTPLAMIGNVVAVPWMATFGFLALGIGILLSQTNRRLMAIITDNVPGGQMLRRSLPLTLLVIVALNWITDRGALLGYYNISLVAPLLTLLNSAVIVMIFWRAAATVNNQYRARLESADELAEATSLLVAVSDNTDDPIFVKDCDGRMIFANPATLLQIGKPREEVLFRTSRELFAAQEEADQMDRDDQRIMQNGQSETLEQTLHLPQGVRTYTSTKAPWYDNQGQLRGIIGISADISERKEMESQLRQREAELETTINQRTATLRRLADHLETVREEEKRAIARELHDDMGASLTSLNMHLNSVYNVLPNEPKWIDKAERINGLINSLVATTRRIQTGLRPIMLDLFGLKAGIIELLEEFEQRTGIECRISLPDEDVKLPHKLEISLYRMLQEALNNVAKHAQATQVEVILDIDEDRAALTVRDDGIGIPTERLHNQSTYGIRGLSERASFLGGTAKVFANPAKGTTVVVELPAEL